MPIDYRHCADSDAVAAAVLALVLQRASAAIARRGQFVLAVSGGGTPQRVYQLLAGEPQNWERWQIVYADERCLPVGDSERNSVMLQRNWLSHVHFPERNHHVPEAEMGADAAAQSYASTIKPLLPLDLALLGMGEDGHTASLFPGHVHPQHDVVPVHHSPKPPSDRVSLSYGALCDADTVCFLVTGPAKQAALQRFVAEADIPAARVRGKAATLVFTDLPLPM